MLKLLDSRKGCSIQLDRFGDNKISKIGFLIGARPKESRDDLSSRISCLVLDQHRYEPSILLAQEKIFKDYGHEGEENSQFILPTSVKCKDSDSETVLSVLTKSFGRPSLDSDFLRPLIRFVPTKIVMLNSKTRAKFISKHRRLDNQIILLKMKNLKPLDDPIIPPTTVTSVGKLTLRHLLSSVIDRQLSEKVFHAVCPHGYEEDTIVLASLWKFSNIVQQCRSHFTTVVQSFHSCCPGYFPLDPRWGHLWGPQKLTKSYLWIWQLWGPPWLSLSASKNRLSVPFWQWKWLWLWTIPAR